MTTDVQQLMNPELMPESTLLEILKNRCIEIPNLKTLKKSDLIEMFKRVALPMPQRRYNEAKYLGKRLNDLRLTRHISIGIEDEEALYKSVISNQDNSTKKSDYSRLKPTNEDRNSETKKIRLSNSFDGTNGTSENGLKRKVNDKEVSAQKEVKKRQKITWP